jgi:hypothetical protein
MLGRFRGPTIPNGPIRGLLAIICLAGAIIDLSLVDVRQSESGIKSKFPSGDRDSPGEGSFLQMPSSGSKLASEGRSSGGCRMLQ